MKAQANWRPARRLLLPAAALLAAAALAGCAKNGAAKSAKQHGEDFPAEEVRRATAAFAEAQAASGARADATLRRHHFDANQLNSLGEERLDLMLKDDDLCEPLLVYVDLPENDPLWSEREQAVLTYLGDRGLRDTQVRLKAGTNPDYMSPAKAVGAGDEEDKPSNAESLPLNPTNMTIDGK